MPSDLRAKLEALVEKWMGAALVLRDGWDLTKDVTHPEIVRSLATISTLSACAADLAAILEEETDHGNQEDHHRVDRA